MPKLLPNQILSDFTTYISAGLSAARIWIGTESHGFAS